VTLERDTLHSRLKRSSRPSSAVPTIPRRPPDAGPAPLSFAQQRLWFLERLRPGTAVYNIPLAIRLQGALDLEALEKSLNEIVRRHAALRTTFSEIDGQPVQVVREAAAIPLSVERLKRKLLRTAGNDQAEVYVHLLAIEEGRRPFDLATGPLVRARLLRIRGRDHVLLLTLHHIVFDGWSAAIFFHELAVLYDVFASPGEPIVPPLPELPIQYADFAVWQRTRLEGEELEQHVAYWMRQLGGMTELQLPSDRPRREVGTGGGARQALVLPETLTDRLKTLARQERTTLYMVLLAAFQELLARYTGQEDIVVGTPISGRTRVETEGLIGFFVNTLPLRTDLSGDPTFRELLGRVRTVALGAYAHQEVPFERLVAELRPERSMGRTPLVPVTFVLQNAPPAFLQLPDLKVSQFLVGIETAKFDLSLEMWEIQGELQGVLSYSTDLFDQSTIERLAGHYRTLLAGAVAAPDTPLSKLPLLTPAERHQLLVEWNATEADFPSDATVHELFETQVAASPEAVAVVDAGASLTYRELNRRANRLAHHLRGLGVGPEVVVGLCLERSAAMVVGMLGILKAGGAYLPLDPSYPSARLAFMLDDAGARVLVTQGEEVPDARIPVVRLDADAAALARQPDEDPAREATADSLAYVVYTSGSVGPPKGVAVPHRAVVRLVVRTDYVSLGPDDVVAQAANAAFDATTFEVWGALLNGAQLVVLPREVLLSPPALANDLATHGVTTIFLTTALFNLLAREGPTALRGVRQVLFGGEVADPGSVAAVLEHGRPGQLLHVYGPTETTTFATWYPVKGVEPGATTVPIGRPIANTTCYVLDQHRRLLPVGVPGELYIGGPGVARGYLHRPGPTNQRFVPDHHASANGARRYRTGDMVRWRPDGTLEFLGRLDEQVKIRGFRVEPAEVAAVLRRHPALREVAVVAREFASGDKRLAAYVVPIAEPAPTPSQLRSFLKSSLPDFMVPSVFMALEALPLTPAGKVDYQALPIPEQRGAAEDGYVAPRTPTEQALAGIWANLLEVEQVGIHDDFFEVGGHSLLVVQAVSRLASDLGIRVPVQAFFAAPTVAELAAYIDTERQDASASDAVPSSPARMVLRAGGTGSPIFFVPGGAGEVANLVKIAQLARYTGGQEPFYGFLREGIEAVEERDPQVRVENLATQFVDELRACQPEGPYVLGGVCSGGTVALEMARQLRAQGQEILLLILVDAWRPGNLGDRSSEQLQCLLGGIWERRTQRNVALGGAAAVHAGADERPLTGEATKPLVASGSRSAVVLPKGDSSQRAESATPPTGEDPLADGRTIYGYQPGPYPGHVVLIVNEEWHRLDPTLGWGPLVTGHLDVHVIPGNHRTYLLEHLDLVGDQLRTHLDQIRLAPRGS
jgi:amino acid adenylation domain-containing protein